MTRQRAAEGRGAGKTIAVLVVAGALLVGLAGCAQLQKKFTRKKKEPATKIPHYRSVKEYVRAPAPQLYQKHYVYWRSWNTELLSVMGKNTKKDMRCINEIISNLQDMKNLLVPEKAAELEPHIARMEGVRKEIAGGDAKVYTNPHVRGTLESEDRAISRDFKYKVVKECVKKGQ